LKTGAGSSQQSIREMEEAVEEVALKLNEPDGSRVFKKLLEIQSDNISRANKTFGVN
jgi:hypothetical protein